MRRTRIQEQGEAARVARDKRRRPEQDGVAGEVLALQRSAGNRAVGSLLAREPDTEEKGDGGQADDKVPEGSAQGTVRFPDPIGSIPIESLQIKGDREVAIVVPMGPWAPKLVEYGQNGTFIATVVLKAAGFTITMQKVVIASVQQSGGGPDGGGGSIYLTLSHGAREVVNDKLEAEKSKKPEPPGWGRQSTY
jgi:hypothetical protein